MTPTEKSAAYASKRRYHEKNRERIAAAKRKHYYANREKYMTIERDRQYRARYGITLADYNEMHTVQDGKCAICSADVAGKCGQAFAVDHCHVTGAVRGLLCIKCNSRLGWYEKYATEVDKYLGGVTE